MGAERVYGKGSYFYIEGDEDSRAVFLVKRGRVRHVCASGALAGAMPDAREGDFFGFISSFSGKPRISSAVAVEETVAVQMDGEALFGMMNDAPGIAMRIMGLFSETLQRHDDILLDRHSRAPALPRSAKLLRFAESRRARGDAALAAYAYNRHAQLYPDSADRAEVLERIEELAGAGGPGPFSDAGDGALEYPDGQVVFCEHEDGNELFLVEAGQVRIAKQGDAREMLLAILGPGELFGELALLTRAPRNATATSFGGARLRPVDRGLFEAMLGRSPELVRKIVRSISLRLWFNNARLGLASYKNPATRLFAFLEHKLVESGVPMSSDKPFQFQFGLAELFGMTEVPYDEAGAEYGLLTGDPNLSLSFGKIAVKNPRDFGYAVKRRKQRDRAPAGPDAAEGGASGEPAPAALFSDLFPEEAEGGTDAVLAGLGDFVGMLGDGDPVRRCRALIQIAAAGRAAKSLAPKVEPILSDSADFVGKNAAKCIAELLPPIEAVEVFRTALGGQDPRARAAAAYGLGKTGMAEATDAALLLVGALGDAEEGVVLAALRSLGAMGSGAKRAIPRVAGLLCGASLQVRMLALKALERIAWRDVRLDEAIAAVRALARDDPDKNLRNCAREVYVKLVNRGGPETVGARRS